MNTKTVEIKTSLNPEDRYYKPFNWLAKGLIGAGAGQDHQNLLIYRHI